VPNYPRVHFDFECCSSSELKSRYASHFLENGGDTGCRERYLALISYLPLKHFRAVPKFFQCTFEIQRQLRTSPGLIGYSLEAQPLARKFQTLSV